MERRENQNGTDFVLPENKDLKPVCIYAEEVYKNQYYYNKIFKVKKSAGTGKKKKRNNYYFEFHINDEKYIINFNSKGRTFIYDVTLEVGKKDIYIGKKINQNKEYYEIFYYFIEALKQNGEESIIDSLYKETIELYSIEKDFTFMIQLFLKIYQKKDLCRELLERFRIINENQNNNEKNADRKECLKGYKSSFISIESEADKIIEINNYNPIEFYGIILCYLNYYDYDNFCSVINELYKKKQKDLFEILLIYNDHFKFQINQDLDFFNNFISYTIKYKDFGVFEKGLNYIKDIEAFLNIIEKNKESIFGKYNAQKIENIIKLDDLKFKKDKPKIIKIALDQYSKDIYIDSNDKRKKEMIKNISSIIEFCEYKKTFLIYFTNNFWKNILNYYNEPIPDNIWICFQFRKIFIKYHNLILEVFEENDKKFLSIRKEAINYFEIDEFAFLLDQMIKKNNKNKKMKNIEKLAK